LKGLDLERGLQFLTEWPAMPEVEELTFGEARAHPLEDFLRHVEIAGVVAVDEPHGEAALRGFALEASDDRRRHKLNDA